MKNRLNRLRRDNNKGFTLVEIIVVLVILAILAAIAVPSVLGYVEDARKTQYIAEARSIFTVVQTEEAKFRAENNLDKYEKYPAKSDGRKKYDEFYRTLGSYGSTQNKNIIYNKTGLYVMTLDREGLGSNNKGNEENYIIIWQSSDGKWISVRIKPNKEVEFLE